MYKILFVMMVVTGFQIVRVTSFNLTISPEHVKVSVNKPSVSFICTASVALTGCQFRWWDNLKAEGPLLELSLGSKSQADPAHLNTDLTNYSYSGRGLSAGDCGVSLQVKGWKLWMVACRVRAESGGWKYASADFNADTWAPLLYNEKTPRELVVLPGGEARIMLKAGEPLGMCHFHLSLYYDGISFDQGAESKESIGRHRYLGAGLQKGECGLELTNISEADNGLGKRYLQTHTAKDDWRYITIIVASAPTVPTLSLVYKDNEVKATCEVQESRPVAHISWVLGDEVIRSDGIDDTPVTPQDEWRWPWMSRPIKQTVSFQLEPQDHGQVLKCVVSHVALDQPLEESRIISSTATSKKRKTTNHRNLFEEQVLGNQNEILRNTYAIFDVQTGIRMEMIETNRLLNLLVKLKQEEINISK